MRLILTEHLDAEPRAVADNLAKAVALGLDAAASRISEQRHELVFETVDEGLRVHQGLSLLDGSELRVSGRPHLTTLEIVVPWAVDSSGAKYLAAHTFAQTVAAEVLATA